VEQGGAGFLTEVGISKMPAKTFMLLYVSMSRARRSMHLLTDCKEASWASAYSTSCFNGFVPSALAQTMLRMTSGSPTPKDQRMPKCSAT
jgi:hypothetical protein